jgi:hypothetical protein
MNDFIHSNPHRHPELVSGSIFRFALPERRKTQPHRKVIPMRVLVQDQIDLPRAMPVFELFLAQDRMIHVTKHLEIDKPVNRIFGRKSGRRSGSMLPNPRNQVGRHTNVERAERLARKDIDAGQFFLSHVRSLAVRWTLKQVQGDEIGDS